MIKSLMGFFKIGGGTPTQSFKCNCPKTRSNEYCDSMYTLIQFTKASKNFDRDKAKKIYLVF